MRFKQWLTEELSTPQVKAPGANPTTDQKDLQKAVQTTMQDPRISSLVAKNAPPEQLTKKLIPIAQDAAKKNMTGGTNPTSVTPMDITRASLPQLQVPKQTATTGTVA